MHRFYIEAGQSEGPILELSEREAHHGSKVLRLREGDPVIALNGRGAELNCRVDSISKRGLRLRVEERKTIPPLPWQVTLVQAIPKGKAMETIVQKAAELGAWKIAPIITERTVTHLDSERAESKVEKWNWIAIDAIKQCGSTWLPEIIEPQPLPAFLATRGASELAMVGALQGQARHPRRCLEESRRELGRTPRTVELWVGPEGDFTPGELDQVIAAGAQPISLGPLVLRSDTAAIYCLSIVNYELQTF